MPEAKRERDVERYLVQLVKDLGGEVRKVKWVGRNSAPDRVVMLPDPGPGRGTFNNLWWVELKAPGKWLTFPANAHERAQHREHERMRKMGQRVVIIDSFEGVNKLLGVEWSTA
jgi:hypothetical protein